MFGYNGSLIGVYRPTSFTSASGIWGTQAQGLARQDVQWPKTDLRIISGYVDPTLGRSPTLYIAPGSGAITTPPWTLHFQGGADDTNLFVGNWPFSFYIDNVPYSGCFVGSNSYLTFGAGSSVYGGLSASNPALPKFMFGAADNSYQRVMSVSGYSPDNTQFFKIRYEGDGSSSGQTFGTSRLIVEFTFFEPRAGGEQWVELRVGSHNRTTGLFMVANSSTAYASSTIAPTTDWMFFGNPSGTSWTISGGQYVGT